MKTGRHHNLPWLFEAEQASHLGALRPADQNPATRASRDRFAGFDSRDHFLGSQISARMDRIELRVNRTGARWNARVYRAAPLFRTP